MKLVGIVGYKDSGKTTLARALAQELTVRGHRVAVIKHTSHQIDLAGKDTAMLLETSGQVAILSAQASAVFWRDPMGLDGILAHLDADLVLVEGFKARQGYPKIACLRGLPDDCDLIDDLAIAAIGPTDQVGDLNIPVFDRDDVGLIADLVELVHSTGTGSATA
ncbi:MAG: molybdopterin-guanine dinucleotide biosynthesis protein B [Anaerolineae bacterium]|jgi:molybdopterin-guanine dinucleotide biosynthesis protein B